MKTMKKWICVLLAAAMLLALAACGNKSTSGTETKTDTAAEDNQTTQESNDPGTPPEGQPGTPPEGGPGTPPDGQPGTPPEGGPGGPPPEGGPGGPGGGSGDIDYTGATEITSADTRSGETYASSAADENALLIATSDAVTVTDAAVTKTGDSDGGDNCNFYGLNAAVLVKDGATATITRSYVNVRKGASQSTQKLGELYKGDKVKVDSVSGSYAHASNSKQTGYIHVNFLDF